MFKKIISVFLALILAALLSVLPAAAAASPKINDMSAVSSKLSGELFAELYRQNGGENFFFSPYSLAIALTMANAGAAGNTRSQINRVMGISDVDALMDSYEKQRAEKLPDGVKFTSANGVWINRSQLGANAVRTSWRRAMQGKMGATVRVTDFGPSTTKEISEWARRSTGGLIPNYEPAVKDTDAMDILNAIHFEGGWKNPFDVSLTKKQNFTNLDGTKSRVDMMHDGGEEYSYYRDGKFQGLEVPYRDGRLVMDLVLPVSGKSRKVGEEWAKLSADEQAAFLKGIDRAAQQEIEELALPKFSMDRTVGGLKEALQAAGMTDAFDSERANFDNMAHELFVSDINQRAVLNVDEKGTKAAAVTEITMDNRAMPLQPETPVRFLCDRPFLMFIRDAVTGQVLFAGVCNKL